jgi:hypothetical protein
MAGTPPTTRDMTPDELKTFKAFLDQKTVRSNWDAGTWLSHWLLGAELKIGPVFAKTKQMERIAEQLGLGFKRIWQSLEFRETLLSEEVALIERCKLSLGRAIDLLPAKNGIAKKTSEDEKTALNLEFRSIIETNPGSVRSGAAYKRWNENFQALLDKCADSPKKAQKARFRKCKNAAEAGLKTVHAELEKMCRVLPTNLRGDCEAFLGKIDDVSSDLEKLYSEAEQHFAADDETNKKQPTKKRKQTSSLVDDWMSGS